MRIVSSAGEGRGTKYGSRRAFLESFSSQSSKGRLVRGGQIGHCQGAPLHVRLWPSARSSATDGAKPGAGERCGGRLPMYAARVSYSNSYIIPKDASCL